MEGNGPIQGTPKACGALIFGDDPVAVDATCCRVMGLMPERIKYLAAAGTMLGHLKADKIQQVGENYSVGQVEFRRGGGIRSPTTGRLDAFWYSNCLSIYRETRRRCRGVSI